MSSPLDNRCSLFNRPLRPPHVAQFCETKEEEEEEKLGKETRVHRENDGVEITMVLRLLITIRRENETERKACCTKP